MKVIEPLVSIMAAMEVNFVAIYCCRMVVATGRFGTEGLWLRPTDKVVKVQYIQIV